MQPDALWTVQQILHASRDYLAARGVEEARLEAEYLLSSALGWNRLRLYTDFDMPLDASVKDAMREFIRRRGRGEPTAYILGVREFYGLPFRVDHRVLIPRPETEHLVDEALHALDAREAPARVLDLCTGSGCITIALAHARPHHEYVGVDISEAALSVAEENRKNLVGAARVSFLCGDLYEPAAEGTFDLILSNPPYITADELAQLHPTVRNFEPLLALDSGDDSIAFHCRIIELGLGRLRPEGRFILEIGAGSLDALESLAHRHELRLRMVNDLAGHPRVAVLER
jgi:release factor glutamine methyltransferase